MFTDELNSTLAQASVLLGAEIGSIDEKTASAGGNDALLELCVALDRAQEMLDRYEAILDDVRHGTNTVSNFGVFVDIPGLGAMNMEGGELI